MRSEKIYHPVIKTAGDGALEAAQTFYEANKGNVFAIVQPYLLSSAMSQLGIPEAAAMGSTQIAALYVGFAMGHLFGKHGIELPSWEPEKPAPVPNHVSEMVAESAVVPDVTAEKMDWHSLEYNALRELARERGLKWRGRPMRQTIENALSGVIGG